MSLFYACFEFAAITAYTFNNEPQYDTSTLGTMCFSALITLIVGQIANIVFFRARFLDNLLAIMGAIVFASYIIFDTQMIVTGRKKKQSFSSYFFSPEDSKTRSNKVGEKSGNKRNKKTIKKKELYYNSKDYIIASLNLYLDLLGLVRYLMKIIQMFQGESDSNQDETNDD